MAAAAAPEVERERDLMAVRAAQILVSLRSRKLREWPRWVPMEAGEALKWWEGVRRRPRSSKRRGSGIFWRKVWREMGLAASTMGSGGEERDAAPASARRPVEAMLCYGAAAGSGAPSTSSAVYATPPPHADEKAAVQAQALAAAPAKEPMKAPSPDTPLEYNSGGSRASSSADDAARPPAKRRGPGARGSGGGDDDEEGCSSPAKRARVAADEEQPIPRDQSMQTETRAPSSKGLAIDLNLPPPPDEGAC